MMKSKIEDVKLACALLLLLLGVVMGIVMFLEKGGPAQNHYLYAASYMDNAVLVPTYLPIYAGMCILAGAYLLSAKK